MAEAQVGLREFPCPDEVPNFAGNEYYNHECEVGPAADVNHYSLYSQIYLI